MKNKKSELSKNLTSVKKLLQKLNGNQKAAVIGCAGSVATPGSSKLHLIARQ